MNFVVLFEDNPEKAGKRAELMSAHLAFLRSKGDQVPGAGPLTDAHLPAGGLWLVNAESREDVMTLVKEDPFWPTGLRKSVRILEWTKVHAAG